MSEKLPGEADKGIESFDHTGKQYSSSEEMKQVALESYKKMKGNAPEKLISGSDDFTMFLWETSVSKHPKTRMTDHQQLVDRVYFSPDGQWVASASFDRSVKLCNGIVGKFVAAFSGHAGPVYQIRSAYFARYGDEDIVKQSTNGSLSDIWDIRTKKLKQDLPGHVDEVCSLNMVIRQVLSLHVYHGLPLAYFSTCSRENVFAVDWNPDGENVASGGKDKVLKLWMG
ncbi:notchless protein homolog [Eucalyptus grandis]|uniref:notchless protein homolog n=1 Tax=Eucalyptus grandis TaxID=71139 RepID=UPI00192EAAD2|nr:notchless protein homolog [Eucalyptus grandis]